MRRAGGLGGSGRVRAAWWTVRTGETPGAVPDNGKCREFFCRVRRGGRRPGLPGTPGSPHAGHAGRSGHSGHASRTGHAGHAGHARHACRGSGRGPVRRRRSPST
ncbi:hypothetical protein CG747_03450 [Streptomyces sp. CB02959]|nr:hypothetical protein CG747_03450 [Streptomyces sp. CB02959]